MLLSLYGRGGHVYQFQLEPGGGGGEAPLALQLPILMFISRVSKL